MALFEIAYEKTMKNEGEYSNDPIDSGGETWKGVARNFNKDWLGWKIIDKKKKEPNFPKSLKNDLELESLVSSFYKKIYWDVMRLDEYPSQQIANELFDVGINMGRAVAVKFLQRSLNILNNQESFYKDIVADGLYGNGTHKSVMSFFSSVAKDRWITLYKALNSLQGSRYIEIMESKSSQEKYAYGWFTRVYEDI
jgi:lysozyme family protein